MNQINTELCIDCISQDIIADRQPIKSTDDALDYFEHFRCKKQEYFICLSLDSRRKPISRHVITIGLLDVSLVHPREVYAKPITERAVSIIICHNHPSGVAQPSKVDIDTTRLIATAGLLLGVPLYDHLIIAATTQYSFKQTGLLQDASGSFSV